MESNTDAPQAQMPRYKCHKEVHALKIAKVEQSPPDVIVEGGSYTLTPEDGRYAPFYVSDEFAKKHKPVAGGYYVVYADGYVSFSPAEAFESGYTLIQ